MSGPAAFCKGFREYLATCAFLIALFATPMAFAKENLWMMPPPMNDGQELRDLFEHPEAWGTTRSELVGIGYADHWLDKQFSDAELHAWLPELNQWGLKLVLEVGAIKPWGQTGEKAFAADRKKWDRFISLGGNINAIAMDEPLSASLKMNFDPGYAVEQTARFVALVRQNYPNILVGDIEPYPGIQEPELLSFIDALQTRLRQMNVRGLDFFRLDVDWMHFVARDQLGRFGWNGVKDVEDECHRRRLPFSLIYWAANFPSLNKNGQANEITWEEAILQQGQNYASVGGRPDEYVIESWVDSPPRSLPETASGSFTKSVLDFDRHFLSGR